MNEAQQVRSWKPDYYSRLANVSVNLDVRELTEKETKAAIKLERKQAIASFVFAGGIFLAGTVTGVFATVVYLSTLI